jgi:HlyD family secretion protein
MTANVSVVVAEKENVLKVPNAALRFRPGPELVPSASAGGPGSRRGRRGGDRDAPGSPPPPAGSDAAPASSAPAAEPSAAAPGEADAPPGGREWRTVWVLRDGRPESIRVRIGITDGTNTEVVEGALEQGQQVIISASGGASPEGTSSPGGNRNRSFRMF